MLISNSRKFIFIHIQKTAGSSIERALQGVVPDLIRGFDDLPASRDPLKNRHLFASDLQRYLGDDTWNSLYKFAFVRNPWARLVSWYCMCVERPSTPFMWLVKRNAKNFEDFLNFTEGRCRRTLFNQVDYVTDSKGKLIVDFVGRFEKLEDDFSQICAHLDLRLSLPHVNKGKVTDYRTWYTARTVELVAERFRRDLDAFDYTFE